MKHLRGLMICPMLAVALCMNAAGAFAQTSHHIRFEASNNSARVFVEDQRAKAGTDSNGVSHAAGVRAATDDDDGSSNVMASDGSSLLVSLDKWRSAEGTAQITAEEGHDSVKLTFNHLVAFGEYSLFLADLTDPDASALRALDGSGTNNSFEAKVDGTASLTVAADKHLTHSGAIVLIYHSDDSDHGASPGQLFIDAHQQLIARI
ncbi:MAG: hypothetical protein GIW98_02120 [Candidatus Eremiobacteraeota bacterium]|nr:hypothetical protein [Candidatus Eremiobacteraeota bacterium]